VNYDTEHEGFFDNEQEMLSVCLALDRKKTSKARMGCLTSTLGSKQVLQLVESLKLLGANDLIADI